MIIKDHLYNFLNLIPKGKVVSYNFLSKLFCNHPRGIARINATNQNPDIFACYKVVGENGDISGYINGVEEKIKRLQNDGIQVVNGKVDKSYFWNPRIFNYFISFPLGEDKLDEFNDLIEDLKDILGTKDFSYQKVTTPHITLRFLGDLTLDEYTRIVKDTEEKAPLIKNPMLDTFLILHKLGNFGNRVYFLETGFTQKNILMEFYDEYSEIVSYHQEQRPYHPHMTLFRVKDEKIKVDAKKIEHILEKYRFTLKADKLRFYAAVDNTFQVPLIDISL